MAPCCSLESTSTQLFLLQPCSPLHSPPAAHNGRPRPAHTEPGCCSSSAVERRGEHGQRCGHRGQPGHQGRHRRRQPCQHQVWWRCWEWRGGGLWWLGETSQTVVLLQQGERNGQVGAAPNPEAGHCCTCSTQVSPEADASGYVKAEDEALFIWTV